MMIHLDNRPEIPGSDTGSSVRCRHQLKIGSGPAYRELADQRPLWDHRTRAPSPIPGGLDGHEPASSPALLPGKGLVVPRRNRRKQSPLGAVRPTLGRASPVVWTFLTTTVFNGRAYSPGVANRVHLAANTPVQLLAREHSPQPPTRVCDIHSRLYLAEPHTRARRYKPDGRIIVEGVFTAPWNILCP